MLNLKRIGFGIGVGIVLGMTLSTTPLLAVTQDLDQEWTVTISIDPNGYTTSVTAIIDPDTLTESGMPIFPDVDQPGPITSVDNR